MNSEWARMVEQEGTADSCAVAGVADDGYPACPACGCTSPPKEGECVDCGLMLE